MRLYVPLPRDEILTRQNFILRGVDNFPFFFFFFCDIIQIEKYLSSRGSDSDRGDPEFSKVVVANYGIASLHFVSLAMTSIFKIKKLNLCNKN
jgi:hypothetical protein